VPLLFLDEQPQRSRILHIQGPRTLQQPPALRIFAKLELLDGLYHYGSFRAAQPITIVPRQSRLRRICAEIPQPIGFIHIYTV
jgi:hypothetical protein